LKLAPNMGPKHKLDKGVEEPQADEVEEANTTQQNVVGIERNAMKAGSFLV
jgi:hypothetical protein